VSADFITIPDEDLALMTSSELEGYMTYLAQQAVASGDWRQWIALVSPQRYEFAKHHEDFWEWVWGVKPDERPNPFVAIWPRGGAKSTSTELACVLLAARGARKYGLYVCESQDQADDHVSNVAALLELDTTAKAFPDLAARAIGKYGNVKGWRRNRLMTQSGFILDAMGLDSAARGVKIENQRPDLLVFDDIDSEQDSQMATEKKIKTLTTALLPAGSNDVGVLMCQNLVHQDSIFARLADGRANFLANRIVSGPIPAIKDFTYANEDGRFVITGGEPSWSGQNLDRCQEMITDMGISAFLSECQHDTTPAAGGMFSHLTYQHCKPEELPDLVRTCVWVDPAVTDNDRSDAMGIQCAGIDSNGQIYMLYSYEQRSTPLFVLQKAIRVAQEYGADSIGIETDQGGDTWNSVYREAATGLGLEEREVPRLKHARAGSIGPKTHRASLMLTDYEKGRITHVWGTHGILEKGLHRFPRSKPFDLVDAAFWAWRDLRPGKRKRLVSR
jgi:hypothetical protein